MKFSQFIAKDAFERSVLRLAVLSLSVVCLTFGVLMALDLSKDAIVVERACETKLLEVTSSSQSKDEVKKFVEQAVSLRFNSVVGQDPSAYMIQDLLVARTKEQEELKRSGIDQRMIVRSVRFDRDLFIVETDRLVAVGKARSAIPTLLIAKVASKSRTLTNPYGLVLTSIDQLKNGPKDE